MEPLTVSIVAAAGMFAWEVGKGIYKAKGEAEKKAAEAKGEPQLVFLPAQVEQFTHADEKTGKVRVFDPDCARVIREDLRQRSAIPEQLPPHLATIATAFRVVPRLPDGQAPRAIEVLEQAQAAGANVLGSLSLALLGSGLDVPYVLIVGGERAPELAPLRAPNGMPATFALIAPPPAAEAKAAAAVPAPETDAPTRSTEDRKGESGGVAFPPPPPSSSSSSSSSANGVAKRAPKAAPPEPPAKEA